MFQPGVPQKQNSLRQFNHKKWNEGQKKWNREGQWANIWMYYWVSAPAWPVSQNIPWEAVQSHHIIDSVDSEDTVDKI